MYEDSAPDLFDFHHSMLVDDVRTQAYLRALLRAVKPGDTVLDIGCGTGVLTLFACLAGAARVYAIEHGPIIEVARNIVERNGFGERVDFRNDWSTKVEVTQPANVLVTETVGNMGFEEGILRWVADARERLLTADALVIPGSVSLMAAPVDVPRDYEDIDRWSRPYYTMDFSRMWSIAVNNVLWVDLSPVALLAEAVALTTVSLEGPASTDVSGAATVTAHKDGVVHGIGCWFLSELVPGVTLSNAPPIRTPSWSHAFLPLETPLQVRAGDPIAVEVASSQGSSQWDWAVTAGEGGRVAQSTAAGTLRA